MSALSVSLFGKLQVRLDEEPLVDSMPRKAQELLAYLLLHRRNHSREKLATLLWPCGTTKRAKTYLRKALWQLRQSIEPDDADRGSVLRADGDWVQIHLESEVWVDVVVFESAFNEMRDCAASDITSAQREALEEAVSLHTGDLLENWYQEWCLKERERLKDMLLRMLDRLTRCCEQMGSYDSGIQYGLQALQIDPARERIHRHLMRLRARAGDRTGALRQFERCAEMLDEELNVRPTTATRDLHERIQEDCFPAPPPRTTRAVPESFGSSRGDSRQGIGAARLEVAVSTNTPREIEEMTLRHGLDRLCQLQSRLAAVQRQLRREVEAVQVLLEQRS